MLSHIPEAAKAELAYRRDRIQTQRQASRNRRFRVGRPFRPSL